MFFINRVVDVGFFTDIFLNFRVARFDRQTGTWITDRKAVALIYVRSTFLIDFLSTVPWDLLSFVVDVGNSIKLMRMLKLLKMAKLVRIYKSSRLFKKLKAKLHLKSSESNLMKYASVFVFVLHWSACAWGIFPQLDSASAVHVHRAAA